MRSEIDIKYIANKVITDYQLEIPINPFLILEDLDIHFSKQYLEPEKKGFTEFNNTPPLLIINNRLEDDRKSFAIAHELGHYFLHYDPESKSLDPHFKENSTYYLLRNQEIDTFEQEADLFAYNLLMPEDEIRKYFEDINDIDNYSIGRAAKKFNVSSSNLLLRLNSLGYRIN